MLQPAGALCIVRMSDVHRALRSLRSDPMASELWDYVHRSLVGLLATL